MTDRNLILTRAGAALLLALALAASPLARAADPAGVVVSTYGTVWRAPGGGDDWRRAGRGTRLLAGDALRTESRSGASLVLDDESLVRLGPNARFDVEQVAPTSLWRRATALVSVAARSTFRLLSGKMWMRNNNRNVDAQIVTTAATIGIRGTELVVEADGERSSIEIQEGSASASSGGAETLVVPGERVTARLGLGFSRAAVVRQRDAVQWTVTIPPIVDPAALIDDPALAAEIARLAAAADYAAIDSLGSRLDGEDARLTLSAWADLNAGASDRAYARLRQRMGGEPAPVALRELAAFAAIVNGDGAQAERWLDALAADGLAGANALVIRGYLRQSQFDLPGAIASYRASLALDAGSATARLQLARALFGSDRGEAAEIEVRRVLAAEPDDAAARNLLGFLQLADLDTAAAVATWESLGDGADADTHFGLSLAYMRQGRTEAAFENIATAIALDPQRSLYLSYWGKMLYQVGRFDRALLVLDSAARLDPADPTPRLYRAIILRDLYRPGEAVAEVQAAIALNGNRGVYRSRSLLDKDRAVQNVDLSLLYNQLGLARWAQARAQASVEADFLNASAHILNAGAFAELDEYSYPLASAALLARLLQPANINAFSSFNSYTTLFEAPKVEQVLEVGAGNHGQQSLAYAAWGARPEARTAWALGALHESDDGWRDDLGESFDDIAFIGKWQPDRDDNFLFTLTGFETTLEGDTYPRFEIDADPDPGAELTSTSLLLELGWHRRLAPDHDLLALLSVLANDGEVRDDVDFGLQPGPPPQLRQILTVDGTFEQPTTLVQLQGVKKTDRHQFIYGVVASRGDDNVDYDLRTGLFDPAGNEVVGLDSTAETSLDRAYRGVYVHDSWKPRPGMQLDAALYHETLDNTDALNEGEWTVEETSPRLGLSVAAGARQTVRVAAFRYLLPFLGARLDPVDVAGVPVFRNAAEGSVVDEVDLVWEYEWARGLLTATAYRLERELTSSALVGASQQESTSEGEKQGGRLTGDFLLGRRSGLAVELESFEVSDEALAAADRDEIRLRLNFAHVLPSGLTLSVEQIQRELVFDSGRDDESIAVTNLRGAWQFDDRRQRVSVEAINLFDEEFNWVTDEFATGGVPPALTVMARYLVQF